MCPEVDQIIEFAIIPSDSSLASEIGCRHLVSVSNAVEHRTRLDEQPQAVISPVQANGDAFPPLKIGISR